MLPPGVYSVTQIEQEKNPVSQVIQLVSLLEFLLNFVNPNQLGKDGKPATVGERVDANRALFGNPPDVFVGIGVRNNIVHAKASDVTDAEIKRAVSHLLNAVKELRQHPAEPAAGSVCFGGGNGFGSDARRDDFGVAARASEAEFQFRCTICANSFHAVDTDCRGQRVTVVHDQSYPKAHHDPSTT